VNSDGSSRQEWRCPSPGRYRRPGAPRKPETRIQGPEPTNPFFQLPSLHHSNNPFIRSPASRNCLPPLSFDLFWPLRDQRHGNVFEQFSCIRARKRAAPASHLLTHAERSGYLQKVRRAEASGRRLGKQMTPEEKVQQKLDAMLSALGWRVQEKDKINLPRQAETSKDRPRPILTMISPDALTKNSGIGAPFSSIAASPGVGFPGTPAWRRPIFDKCFA
jgi:hypothetical protein